ncbi:MAG: glycosyltransferase family 9 protein [Thermodesulfobacteriota bacterium]
MKILIVCLDNLGDLVFSTALIAPLRERFPDMTLGLWCKAYTAAISSCYPGEPVTYAANPIWDARPETGDASYLTFFSALRAIRKARYDIAIIVGTNWRPALCSWLAGINTLIGYASRKAALFLSHAVSQPDRQKPVVSELLRLLQPLHIRAEQGCYALDGSRVAPLEDFGITTIPPGRYVAVHPFALSRRRCLPFGQWQEIIDRLADAGIRPVIVGTRSEQDHFARACPHLASQLFAAEHGITTLAQTVALFAGAKAFIGHDSGPLHIASALGRPVFGLYLPGEPQRTFPQGRGAAEVFYRPTALEVTGTEVWQALARFLETRVNSGLTPSSLPENRTSHAGASNHVLH